MFVQIIVLSSREGLQQGKPYLFVFTVKNMVLFPYAILDVLSPKFFANQLTLHMPCIHYFSNANNIIRCTEFSYDTFNSESLNFFQYVTFEILSIIT
jgi:hypothetical protein